MMSAFRQNSYLFGGNAPFVEELYESYLANPASVDETWRAYFDNLQSLPASDGNPETRDVAHAPSVPVKARCSPSRWAATWKRPASRSTLHS